ncbi:hypothetical protein AFLA_008038 [Aspergillus flavus NRRL3357]|nr:hypothetical protein AFLA_008038 [Aspergillus flavus NRRL3357]
MRSSRLFLFFLFVVFLSTFYLKPFLNCKYYGVVTRYCCLRVLSGDLLLFRLFNSAAIGLALPMHAA